MTLNEEIRKEISLGGYEISNKGGLRNMKTGKVLKTHISGFKKSVIRINGKAICLCIKIEVAKNFVENKEGYKFCYLRDRDPNNCSASNIFRGPINYWQKKNFTHGGQKKIIAEKGGFKKEFPSITSFASYVGAPISTIAYARKRGEYKGYILT